MRLGRIAPLRLPIRRITPKCSIICIQVRFLIFWSTLKAQIDYIIIFIIIINYPPSSKSLNPASKTSTSPILGPMAPESTKTHHWRKINISITSGAHVFSYFYTVKGFVAWLELIYLNLGKIERFHERPMVSYMIPNSWHSVDTGI